MTVRNGRALLVINPPVKKRLVGDDVKALFWRRSFSKSVGNVSPKYQQIFSSQNRVKDSASRLVHTVCVCRIENAGLTGAW